MGRIVLAVVVHTDDDAEEHGNGWQGGHVPSVFIIAKKKGKVDKNGLYHLKTHAPCDRMETVCNTHTNATKERVARRKSSSEPGRVGAGGWSVREDPSGAAG